MKKLIISILFGIILSGCILDANDKTEEEQDVNFTDMGILILE